LGKKETQRLMSSGRRHTNSSHLLLWNTKNSLESCA